MGTAPSTTKKSGIAIQSPMTLCQLKSRAFPDSRRRNQVTLRSAEGDQFRGHQR
jgi:hypothetical protein